MLEMLILILPWMLTQQHNELINDIEHNNSNGILISNNSGIAQKDNFQIDIHNQNIIVYLHNCLYNPDLIIIASHIIDNLQSQLSNISSDQGTITHDELQLINNEYQDLVSHKDSLIKLIKKQKDDLIKQFDKITLPLLTTTLNLKFTNTSKTSYSCDLCDHTPFTSHKAMKAHRAYCIKKQQQQQQQQQQQ